MRNLELSHNDWKRVFARKGTSCASLRLILAQQTPIFDELFLKGLNSKSWHAIDGDEILLPKKLRMELKRLRYREKFPRLRKMQIIYMDRLDYIENQLRDAVEVWVTSLPPNRRRREKRKRFYCETDFIGRHKTALWAT